MIILSQELIAKNEREEARKLGKTPRKPHDLERIRIRLESFNHQLLVNACRELTEVHFNDKPSGVVALPNSKRIYCVLRSPHVDKDSREHFEIRVHRRIVDIFYQYEPEYAKQPVLEKLSQVEFDPGLFCSISYD